MSRKPLLPTDTKSPAPSAAKEMDTHQPDVAATNHQSIKICLETAKGDVIDWRRMKKTERWGFKKVRWNPADSFIARDDDVVKDHDVVKNEDLRELAKKFTQTKRKNTGPEAAIYINKLYVCVSHYSYIPSEEELNFLLNFDAQLNPVAQNILILLFENFTSDLTNSKNEGNEKAAIFVLWKDIAIKQKIPSAEVKNLFRSFSEDCEHSNFNFQLGGFLLFIDEPEEALQYLKKCDSAFLERQKAEPLLRKLSGEHLEQFNALLPQDEKRSVSNVMTKFATINDNADSVSVYLQVLHACVLKFNFLPNDQQLAYLTKYHDTHPDDQVAYQILLLLMRLSKHVGAENKRLAAFFSKEFSNKKPSDQKKATTTTAPPPTLKQFPFVSTMGAAGAGEHAARPGKENPKLAEHTAAEPNTP